MSPDKKKQRTVSPPFENIASPGKKHVQKSAIRNGLEKAATGAKTGLLRFFGQCTPEEGDAQFRRDREKSKIESERLAELRDRNEREKAAKKREDSRIRQQRYRDHMKEKEIVSGKRESDGKKRKLSVCSEIYKQRLSQG